jgi:membrane peptidoglycan carboxypeptidase
MSMSSAHDVPKHVAVGDSQASAPPQRRRKPDKRLVGLLLLVMAVTLVASLLAWEFRTSRLQALLISRVATKLDWQVRDGEALQPLRSTSGPHDRRNGYDRLPAFQHRLEANGFRIAEQARPSRALREVSRLGITPPYAEKPVGALEITGGAGVQLYRARTDRFHYQQFAEVPPLIVQSLLFVEDRSLLVESQPHLNPAVEWDRFAWASFDYVRDRVVGTQSRVGGSTLATQIQKFRHSPSGRTSDPAEKLRQMLGASLYAYRDGTNTQFVRQRIVVDYLNSMPMGARRGAGEILGLGEGMWAWFGKTPEELVIDLSLPEEGAALVRKATTYAQALSLILATRRPARYLGDDPHYLNERLDLYLRELFRAGMISGKLAATAREVQVAFAPSVPPVGPATFVERRAADGVRLEAMDLLGVDQFYDLDRLDLRIETTLDAAAQRRIQEKFRAMLDVDFLAANGMLGKRLLNRAFVDSVLVTFSLFKTDLDGNQLLVHADNLNQPLDLQRSAKLELGSTAKLRTLANYLNVMAALYERYHDLTPASLSYESRYGLDPLSRWAAGYVLVHPDASRGDLLRASVERPYSASPGTRFWTGGGVHTFSNFDSTHNHSVLTVRMATRHSSNLVYVRLMRDLVDYYVAAIGFDQAAILSDREHEDRQMLLEAAAERESRQLLWAAYTKYERMSRDELSAELQRSQEKRWLSPIASWLLAEMVQNPSAGWLDVLERSAPVREESFRWLLRSRSSAGQNTRIRTELERRAFDAMHADWRLLGYPFSTLVPSLATALGSSADRPDALAELLGIVQNHGLRVPQRRIQALHFAERTPYETRFEAEPADPRRVMSEEAAALLREMLIDVVEHGTGRRAHRALLAADGTPIAVGGKTGSGDNRFERFDANGNVISSRAINRTATFAFLIGEHHYGVVTTLVTGSRAENYSFTSALALQVFKTLAPAIEPLVQVPVDVAVLGLTSSPWQAAP